MLPVGDDAPLDRRPVITYALIAANAAVFLVLWAQSGAGDLLASYGLVPSELDPLTLGTALLLNASVWQLAVNAGVLYVIGKSVENAVGRPAYLLYYLLGSAVALLAYVAIHPSSTVPLVAANGAVAGILVGYLVFFPRAQIRFLYWAWYWRGSFYLPAWTVVAAWFALQVGASLAGGRASGALLANWVLAGGVVAGLAVAVPLRRMAAGLVEQYDQAERADVSLPTLVQQEARVRQREPEADAAVAGTPLDPALAQWAARIEAELAAHHLTGAIRLYERRGGALHAAEQLTPRTRYALAEACLARGHYWRAATLLETLVGPGTPPKVQTHAHALLAALYGEHPYFHESATPHLERAMADLPQNAPARQFLHEVERKIGAARAANLTVRDTDRFCLLRQTAEAYRIADAARIVAAGTDRDLREVMRDLRNNRGIVAWKLSRKRAFDLAAALGNAGIQVGVVPLSALQGYDKVEKCLHVSVKPHGLTLQLEDETLEVEWDDVTLVCGGYLVLTSEQQRTLYDEAHRAALESGDAVASFESMARELRHLTLVDLWLTEPRRHLRVREHPLRMPEAQLQAVVASILRTAPGVPRNDGLGAVGGGVVPPDCMFDGRDDFTYYGLWHVQLQQWDELGEVTDSLIQNLTEALRAA